MNFTPDQLVLILKETVVALVQKDGPDLSARQLGVLLTCYLNPEAHHTVRGLADTLQVSKPAITRALDRLTELKFADREVDHRDRRSVLVQRTVHGDSFVRDLKSVIAKSINDAGKVAVAA